MQKKLWGIQGVCFAALLSSGAAFAEPSCPDGMREFVNSETQERVCIPADVQQTPIAQQAPAEPQHDMQPRVIASEPAAADDSNKGEQPKAAESVPEAEKAAQASDAAADKKDANASNTAADSVDLASAQVYDGVVGEKRSTVQTEKDRRRQIHNSLLSSGGTIEFGLGYGFVANANIHVAAGYQIHTNDTIASFGIYFDANFKPGEAPGFSVDLTIDPTLHLSKGQFRFSFGLGIGMFLSKERGWLYDFYDTDGSYYYNANRYHESSVEFELKPRLSFDWFLSTQGYFGGAIDMPMVIADELEHNIAPMVNFDLHVGCKF